MCGRYTLRRINLVFTDFDAVPQPTFEEFDQRPRFNIAPSQLVALVRMNSSGSRVVSMVKWGLIPSWSKERPKLQPINARAETLAKSPMFRQAFDRRRCLIPADGFYEWQGNKPPKRPYFIHEKDDGLFAFAGLWERWKPSPDAEPIDTCTIITTQPNDLMRPIHNRMPVILDKTDYARWLDRQVRGGDVEELLKPYRGELRAEAIGTRVNSVKNEGPELIEADSHALVYHELSPWHDKTIMEREKPKMMRVLVQNKDGTKEHKTVRADKIRSGIRKHHMLPPDLVERAKKLFPRAGNAVYPTMQEWLDCFLCDQYPDQEIAIWERIADVTDKFWLEESNLGDSSAKKQLGRLDRRTLTHVVIAISSGTVDIPSQIRGVTDEQVEIIRTVWAAD